MRQAMSLQQVYSDRSPKTEFCGWAIAEARSQNRLCSGTLPGFPTDR